MQFKIMFPDVRLYLKLKKKANSGGNQRNTYIVAIVKSYQSGLKTYFNYRDNLEKALVG